MVKSVPKCIVDTNVPKLANGHTADNMQGCVSACIDVIKMVVEGTHRLCLDDDGEIFEEYRKQLNISGQPKVGDVFLKWVHDNQWNDKKIVRVSLTRKGEYEYEEFPKSIDLEGFDKSDKKFVAVANSHPEKPPILVASDHKWWNFKDILSDQGIVIQFLCPEHIQNTSHKKDKLRRNNKS
jgi:hypothetical protein